MFWCKIPSPTMPLTIACTGCTKWDQQGVSIDMQTLISQTQYKEISSNPPPDFLDQIPKDADCFINVRVTRRFKNRVLRFSESRGTTVTKTVLNALYGYIEP
jgi:hypothetical protein